ncbi:MAG TPA: hypothetical protein VNW92_20760 [Polyangiaceae bacterium]|jgi:hypothetical protein|nr:hypothetical protein [Polyangiaceae bacterium]
MNDLGVGATLARERLRGAALPLVLALSGCVVYALAALERRASGSGAADSALEGPVFGLALPILAYLLIERACDAQRLDRSVDTVARYGADRRAVMLGVLLTSAAWMAIASALLTALALLGAHSLHDSDLARDLRSSVGIALVSGAVYALWFGAASLIGKRGGGRKWALILDFVLGAGSSALAAPWPRAHARNLLGGAPVLEMSQGGAWLALIVIGVASVALSVRRTSS